MFLKQSVNSLVNNTCKVASTQTIFAVPAHATKFSIYLIKWSSLAARWYISPDTSCAALL